MATTFGFYNSLNDDRLYNALQMSSIFDGIITDGVFMSIGTAMAVTPTGDMHVLVGSGKAWFNHTWTDNDTPAVLTIDDAELVLRRIDVVVLDINGSDSVRANSFKVVKGVPSSNPQIPPMIHVASHHQYPLAYIYVNADVDEITALDITNMIGTSETPYISGILETVDLDSLFVQWEAEVDANLAVKDVQFQEWFDAINAQLTTGAATALQLQINELVSSTSTLPDLITTLQNETYALGQTDLTLADAISAKLAISAKASSTDVDAGVSDDLYVTPSALQASVNVPFADPVTVGNVLTSDGNKWVSQPPTGGSGGASAPTGAIVEYPANSPIPEGWLDLDSLTASRTTYSALFSLIGTSYGYGNGSTTFDLPRLPVARQYVNRFGYFGNMPDGRAGHTTTILSDGRILLAGGVSGTGVLATQVLGSCYIGTISGNSISWVSTTDLPAPRMGHTMTMLADGRLLFAGGSNWSVVGFNNCYIGTVSGNTITWVVSTNLIAARTEHGMVLLPDGRVALIGGMSGTTYSGACYYGTITGDAIAWVVLSTAVSTFISRFGYTVRPNGDIITAGGRGTSSRTNAMFIGTPGATDIAWRTQSSTYGGLLGIERDGLTLTAIDNDTLIAIGGSAPVSPTVVLNKNEVEICKPIFKQVAITGQYVWSMLYDAMPVGIRMHSALKISDGRILVFGGSLTDLTGAGSYAQTAITTSNNIFVLSKLRYIIKT